MIETGTDIVKSLELIDFVLLADPVKLKMKLTYYLQRSYPSEYTRDIRIEFIIISIEDTSGSSWLYLINVLTNPSSPLHLFAFSF